MTAKVSVVVGSGGQDGTLLSQLLERRGWEVLCITRRNLDISDPGAVSALVRVHKPATIYFLAAHHHSSENLPSGEGNLFRESMRVHFDAAVNFLDSIAAHSPATRFFYASSSHVFGMCGEDMQTEDTPLQPETPYAITKVAGMMACRRYRETQDTFASIGILYNHESPLRSPHFITRKLAIAAARIAHQEQGEVVVGDLDARVDWGYAPDFVDAMTRILELGRPDDYIVATGETHSVREFAEIAFGSVGLNYRNHVVARPNRSLRQSPARIGDASRLRRETGWAPAIGFEEMVVRMVNAEMEAFDAE